MYMSWVKNKNFPWMNFTLTSRGLLLNAYENAVNKRNVRGTMP